MNAPEAHLARLRELLGSLLDLDLATLPESGLDRTPHWDSLMQLRIIMAVESAFGISIPSSALEQLTTYPALEEFLLRARFAPATSVSRTGPLHSPVARCSNRQVSRSNDQLLQANVLSALKPYYGRPVLVHCDALAAAAFVGRENLPGTGILAAHAAWLDRLPVKLRISAFHYQFPRSGRIDLRTAPVEVGSLNQYMLEHWAGWRTTDPIFSWLVRTAEPAVDAWDGNHLVAFGERSAFAESVAQQGAVLLYGTGARSLTLIHHAEWRAGGVPYRYQKRFVGNLVDWNGNRRNIDYLLHVRPWDCSLDYDWAGIAQTLITAGAMRPLVPHAPRCGYLVDASGAVAALTQSIQCDPLCLLDRASRAWVEPALSKLGRAFELADFETALVG